MESRRFSQMEMVLNKACNKALEGCDFKTFRTECFPSVGRTHEALLFDVYSQFVQIVRSNVRHEFEAICADVGLREKLFHLEQIEADQAEDKSVRRPVIAEVTPAEHMRTAARAVKEEEKARLQAMLAELNRENAALKNDVQVRRTEYAASQSILEDKEARLERAVSAVADSVIASC